MNVTLSTYNNKTIQLENITKVTLDIDRNKNIHVTIFGDFESNIDLYKNIKETFSYLRTTLICNDRNFEVTGIIHMFQNRKNYIDIFYGKEAIWN